MSNVTLSTDLEWFYGYMTNLAGLPGIIHAVICPLWQQVSDFREIHDGVYIRWEKRSLQEFGDYPPNSTCWSSTILLSAFKLRTVGNCLWMSICQRIFFWTRRKNRLDALITAMVTQGINGLCLRYRVALMRLHKNCAS